MMDDQQYVRNSQRYFDCMHDWIQKKGRASSGPDEPAWRVEKGEVGSGEVGSVLALGAAGDQAIEALLEGVVVGLLLG